MTMNRWLILVLVAIAAWGQPPPPPPQARIPAAATSGGGNNKLDAKDRARLEGVVVNAATGEPLRKVTVTARGSSSGGGQQFLRTQDGSIAVDQQEGPGIGVTDALGNFVIEDVAPGRYAVTAARTGFVNAQWGSRGPGKQGAPLTIAAGQKVRDLTIRMTPQGVVSGRVVDEDGDPMQGVMVQALRYVYNQGKRVAGQVNSANTNDLGEFRLPNLPPGRIFLLAVRQSFGARPAKAKEAYPVAFYPNAPDLASAEPIDVTPGSDLRGVEFRMRKVRAFRVAGRLLGMPAGQRTAVMLIPRDMRRTGVPYFGNNNAVVAPDGSFEVTGVLPGAYDAMANARSQGAPSLFARQQVDVANEDVNDLSLTLGPGLNVAGTVRADAGELPPGSRMQVRFNSADGNNQSNTNLKPDGKFSFGGMSPGVYNADLTALPDGYYLKSVRLGDVEIGPGGLDLTNAQSAALEFVIAPGAAVVAGSVQGKDGKPVAGIAVSIHPKDPALARSDREKSTLTDQNGAFTFSSMAPGEYAVFAWDDAENGAWLYPEFRKPFESDASTVKLSSQGRETVQLKPIVTDK